MLDRASFAVVGAAIALLAVMIGAVLGAGCSTDGCARHSDCASGLICSPAGACELPPDGAAGDAGADATPIRDGAPLFEDASEHDAATDAAQDDATDATVVDATPEDATLLDASLVDASPDAPEGL